MDSEKIGKILKKDNFNSEMIWKIWQKVSWRVKRYGKCGKRVS
jgi:hypothetical protein